MLQKQNFKKSKNPKKPKWKNTRKSVIIKEIVFIIIEMAIILSPLLSRIKPFIYVSSLGIIIRTDINCLWNGIPCPSSCDILIQIQATIVTLALTIITLFASILDKSDYGISWPNYFLNKKPKFLKYRFVIVISLLLLMVNIILHLWKNDAFVIPVFLSSIFLIFYAIFSVYPIFSGKENIKHELEDYFIAQFNGEKYLENQSRLLTDFAEDWEKLTSIYASEYKKHEELYLKALEGIMY